MNGALIIIPSWAFMIPSARMKTFLSANNGRVFWLPIWTSLPSTSSNGWSVILSLPLLRMMFPHRSALSGMKPLPRKPCYGLFLLNLTGLSKITASKPKTGTASGMLLWMGTPAFISGTIRNGHKVFFLPEKSWPK